jgi:hypothetical protein
MLSRPNHFYRIVGADPPTLRDVTSMKALGKTLRFETPEALRIWDGISVSETLEQARLLCQRRPHLGRFVAKLEIPPDSGVLSERTTKTQGHWTLWATPEELLACVVTVTSAETIE